MYETVIGIFISVFFLFGLYCALSEVGRIALRILRERRKRKGAIDTSDKKDYNDTV